MAISIIFPWGGRSPPAAAAPPPLTSGGRSSGPSESFPSVDNSQSFRGALPRQFQQLPQAKNIPVFDPAHNWQQVQMLSRNSKYDNDLCRRVMTGTIAYNRRA